jgi:hypothetical protein
VSNLNYREYLDRMARESLYRMAAKQLERHVTEEITAAANSGKTSTAIKVDSFDPDRPGYVEGAREIAGEIAKGLPASFHAQVREANEMKSRKHAHGRQEHVPGQRTVLWIDVDWAGKR